jgi:hypothetical protein
MSIVLSANDINIIASKECGFNTINHKSIKDLFMKKTKYYKNTHIEVLDNKECYNSFIQNFLKKTPTRMRVYWTRMIFTGSKKPPKKISNDRLKKERVSNMCRVSYTTLADIQGWKVIDVTP